MQRISPPTPTLRHSSPDISPREVESTETPSPPTTWGIPSVGQYTRRHRIADFTTPLDTAQWSETYPARLRQAGYRTGFIGKFGVEYYTFRSSAGTK